MVMHLQAQSDLREQDLEEDVRDPKVQEFLNIKIDERRCVIFLDSSKEYSNTDFMDESGFNLRNGSVYLGNIQFERPAVNVLRGHSLPPGEIVVGMTTRNWEKQVRTKPVLFAIERLFQKPLERLEVTGFYCDGIESPDLREREKALIDTEMAKYREMIAASKIGKPLIEADYKARKWTRLADGVDMNKLYGERIHRLL